MSKDIHKDEFDEATLVKLKIFEEYFKKWMGVFTAGQKIYWKQLNVFDFFAGTGKDKKDNLGSPLIILKHLYFYEKFIVPNNIKVNLYFNEYDKNKYLTLVKNIKDTDLPEWLNITVENKDFGVLFQDYLPIIQQKGSSNLLFLDQNGVKHITIETFQMLVNADRTDFMFFISTTHLKRFMKHSSIIKYLNLESDFFEGIPHYHIHKKVAELYKDMIPQGRTYYTSSFTLKKPNGNIYGLIFGSPNPKGMERFLDSVWKVDSLRGEANFDIDEEKIIDGQLDLFTSQLRKANKVEKFESEIIEAILDGSLKTDRDLYLYCLNNGFVTSLHVKPILKKLFADGKIENHKNLVLNYDVIRKGSSPTNIILK